MLGYRLQELRLERNLSQRELAKLLSISVYTVSSYERGKSTPDDEIKIKIAKLFNVSLDYLLGLTDKKYNYIRQQSVVIPPNLSKKDLEKIQDYIDMVTYRSKVLASTENGKSNSPIHLI